MPIIWLHQQLHGMTRLLNCFPLNYFARLNNSKRILWCYLIWYLVTLYNYFDPSPTIWFNSIGISAVIGFALQLSVNSETRKDNWQTFRLYLMPFCVSSFSSLIKGRGFILIAPPALSELLMTIASCSFFILFVHALKLLHRRYGN